MTSTNSNPSCPSAQPPSPVTRLTIQGIGNVISFKNNKMLARGRLFTKPEYQAWMDRATESIVLQLFSKCQTGDAATQLECWKRLRTFLSGLSDDSVKQLPEGAWKVEFVEAVDAGADILIERL